MKKYFFYISLGLLPLTQHVRAQGIMIGAGTKIVQTGDPVFIVMNDNASFESNEPITATGLALKGTGTGATDIKGSSMLQIGQVHVAKNAGSTIVLQKDLGLDNGITFTGGNLDLNGHNVVLAGAASLTGESETSRVTGSTGGYVQIAQTLNAPLGTNPGNIGLAITSGANLGNTTIKRRHTISANQFGGSSIARNFEVTADNNTGLNAQLRAYYFDAEANGLDENTYEFYRSDNNGNDWQSIGSTGRDATQNFVNADNVQSMALFTLSNTGNVLHVPGTVGAAGTTFSLAQNPVQNVLTINIHSDATMQLAAVVYDMQGRRILEKPVNIYPGSINFAADINALAPGSYRISLSGNGRQQWQAAFVKQ